MAQSSTSAAAFQDMYLSDIVIGAPGDKYQRELALLIFERATRKGYDFQLGYEMAIADKFDDIAFFNKCSNDWTLIQVKYADTSKGKLPPLKFEMLFPSDEGTRDKGDFSLFKYLKSYMIVQANITERKNVIIFTNRKLSNIIDNPSVKVESRQADEILLFGNARHVRLEVNDIVIQEMLDYVNRDFITLRDSIVKLFKEGLVDQTIKCFKTPVASILTKINNSVKFSTSPPSEACPMLTALRELIDLQTAELPLKYCKDLFTGRSRIKTLPLLVNEDTVRQFFRDLILAVQQPDDLYSIINQDLHSWMRTWIRPEYLQRLEKPQMIMATVQLETYFYEKQSQVNKSYDGRFYKRFLNSADGEEFFHRVKLDLYKIIQHFSNITLVGYYVNRQIEITELSGNKSTNRESRVKTRIHDTQFANELSDKFNSQKFLLLAADPGMGKSVILQFIALEVQRNNKDCVYLFDLIGFHRQLSQLQENDTFDNLLSVLSTVLSKTSFDNLIEIFKSNCNETLLIFDGFDEVFPQNRQKILKLFSLMLKRPNIKILVSTRNATKTLMENLFKVKAINLVPFSVLDQMNFLRQFWKVSPENETSFRKYVGHLFKSFHADINRVLCKFTGSPLMLKMFAEVYVDHFTEYLCNKQHNLDEMMPQKVFSLNDLYEQFLKKCFVNKMMKKFASWLTDMDEEYDTLYGKFVLEHQLLAIKRLHVEDFKTVFHDKQNVVIVAEFEKRIICSTERSPLVEAVDNDCRFIHQSCADFLVATFLFENIERYEAEIFGTNSRADLLNGYPIIRTFFFTLIENKLDSSHLHILQRHYKKNWNVALWACEVHGLRTVQFLLRNVYISTITNQLLFVAAQYNCYNICAYLFENHRVVVDLKIEGRTALHIAAERNHIRVVQLLIDMSFNINAQDMNYCTPLHLAAKKGYIDIVKVLIDHSGDVNAKDIDDWTPFHHAAESGRLDVVKILIDHAADIEGKNNKGWTPLHLACQYGHFEIAKTLIDHSEDINTKEFKGLTPLHLAARKGLATIVRNLINSLADVHAKENDGWTPLHFATQTGYIEVVNILIDHSVNINEKNNKDWTALHLASQNGHSEIVKILIEKAGNVNVTEVDGLTPLHLAAVNGHLEVMKMLINHSGNIDAKDKDDCLPLHYASQNGHLNVVKLLIEHSRNINDKNTYGLTPLHYASQNGHPEVVKTLIDHVKNFNDKNNKGWTSLHYAAESGHLNIVKMLIDYSANIDDKNNKGFTPLHFAANNGHLDVVKTLIDHSGNINAKEMKGCTPLHLATRKGYENIVKILTDGSGDINAKEIDDLTALHIAAENGHSKIVKILIDHSANVNAREIDDWTPLHFASQMGHSEVVKLLIDLSGNINAKNDKGWTPLHFACHSGRSEVVKILIDHAGNIDAKEIKGCTPLHLAAETGHTNIVKDLLENFANIDAKNNNGRTPLHIASQNGHLEIVKLLIGHAADASAKDNDENKALDLAALFDHKDIAEILTEIS